MKNKEQSKKITWIRLRHLCEKNKRKHVRTPFLKIPSDLKVYYTWLTTHNVHDVLFLLWLHIRAG
jgi:hypothetical protein